MKNYFTALLAMTLATPALADVGFNDRPRIQSPTQCAVYKEVEEFLATVGEIKVNDEKLNDKLRIVVFASKEKPSGWTILLVNNSGVACMIAAGQEWYKGQGV